MIHVVIDTNVLVSALLSTQGNEAALVLAIAEKLFVPCVTNNIVDEYNRVLASPRFNFPAEKISAALTALQDHAKFYESTQTLYRSPDPTDTKFLQCAFASSADFLVTGNKRHFPMSHYGSTYVVNTRELFTQLNLTLP